MLFDSILRGKNFFLTGATGTLGVPLVRKLLESGARAVFCLVRGKDPEARLRRIFGDDKRIAAISGDISLPKAGVSQQLIRALVISNHYFIHAAADISFDPTKQAHIEKINIHGTQNAYELSKSIGSDKFVLVSSAYANEKGANAYERSKAAAEKFIIDQGGDYLIVSPGVIVGDPDTGEIVKFESYYGLLRVLWKIKQRVEKSNRLGLEFNKEGDLILPIRIPCSDVSCLNLVSNRWVAEMICTLIAQRKSRQKYYLINSRPPKTKWLFEVSLPLLGITGFNFNGHQVNESLQTVIEGQLRPYLRYIQKGINDNISDERLVASLSRALGSSFYPDVEMNKETVGRLLAYAKDNNFGL
ncbi:NAD(P)H-binding protein [Candidatus Falkowbacteria bacterium]|nr:NAD(P)H-binding protein [Candidatus Falkowbacteria bacterium]